MEEIIGKKFNRLTILRFSHKDKWNDKMFECECECGNKIIAIGSHVKNGKIKSCGCLRRDKAKQTKHGLCYSRIYRVWAGLKDKCSNKNNINYVYYGARGIKIYKEWNDSFESFYQWAINNGHKEEILTNGINKWTIDRIDNNGNYEPSNCRWVDMNQQSKNKRNSILVKFNNEVKTIKEWRICLGYKTNRFEIMYNKLGSIEKVIEYFKSKENKNEI